MTTIPGRRRGERGFVMVIVLWTVGLLALMMTVLVANARQEAKQTVTLRDQAIGRAAADGVLSETVMEILRGGKPAPGPRRFADVPADLALEDLSGRLNPNIAPVIMTQGLLAQIGVPPDRAERLAAAIVDWRTPGLTRGARGAKAEEYKAAGLAYGPPGKPFETVDELGMVLGMDAAVLAALKPHLTLWSTSLPNPAAADAAVLSALRAASVPVFSAPSNDARVIQFSVTAHPSAKTIATRRAIIRFGYSPDGRDWRVLVWDDGDPAGTTVPE